MAQQDLTEHVRYLDADRKNIKSYFTSKLASLKEKKDKHMKTGLTVVEVGAGALAAGVLSGRAEQHGGSHVLGIPTNLAVGAAAIVAGVLEVAGPKHSDHFTNVGVGFLAEFAGNMGFGVGQKWAQTGHLFGGGGGGGAVRHGPAARRHHVERRHVVGGDGGHRPPGPRRLTRALAPYASRAGAPRSPTATSGP